MIGLLELRKRLGYCWIVLRHGTPRVRFEGNSQIYLHRVGVDISARSDVVRGLHVYGPIPRGEAGIYAEDARNLAGSIVTGVKH